jgi:hypothetical protein
LRKRGQWPQRAVGLPVRNFGDFKATPANCVDLRRAGRAPVLRLEDTRSSRLYLSRARPCAQRSFAVAASFYGLNRPFDQSIADT